MKEETISVMLAIILVSFLSLSIVVFWLLFNFSAGRSLLYDWRGVGILSIEFWCVSILIWSIIFWGHVPTKDYNE